MEIMFDDNGTACLVINYRCKECGLVVSVLETEEKGFNEKNPACPECHAKNCWELIEEDEE